MNRVKTAHRVKGDKIQEALDLLNEAAHDKRDEIIDLMGDKYNSIKEVLAESALNGRKVVEKAGKTMVKQVQARKKQVLDRVEEIDEKAHENPWLFIGTVAGVAALVGVFLGRKTK